MNRGLATAVPLGLCAAGASDVGCVRARNEDAFLADAGRRVFIVADGMGGRPSGDVAARMVVDLLPALIEKKLVVLPCGGGDSVDSVPHELGNIVIEVSEAIRAAGKETIEHLGMGATMAAMVADRDHAYIAHMGDSRVYLMRGGGLRLLTEDHSIIGLLLRHGEISANEAVDHPARGRLSRFLGMEPCADSGLAVVEMKAGDRFLLCTDGLWNMVKDDAIRDIMASDCDCGSACRELIAAGRAKGGFDNLTAVVVDICGRTESDVFRERAKDEELGCR